MYNKTNFIKMTQAGAEAPYSVDFVRGTQYNGTYLRRKASILFNIARMYGKYDAIDIENVNVAGFYIPLDAKELIIFAKTSVDPTGDIFGSIDTDYLSKSIILNDQGGSIYSYTFNLQGLFSPLRGNVARISLETTTGKLVSIGAIALTDVPSYTPNNGDHVAKLHLNRAIEQINKIYDTPHFVGGYIYSNKEFPITTSIKTIGFFNTEDNYYDSSLSVESKFIFHSSTAGVSNGAELQFIQKFPLQQYDYTTQNSGGLSPIYPSYTVEPHNAQDDTIARLQVRETAGSSESMYQISQVIQAVNNLSAISHPLIQAGASVNLGLLSPIKDMMTIHKDSWGITAISTTRYDGHYSGSGDSLIVLGGLIYTRDKVSSAYEKGKATYKVSLGVENETTGNNITININVGLSSVVRTVSSSGGGGQESLLTAEFTVPVNTDLTDVAISIKSSASFDILYCNLLEY